MSDPGRNSPAPSYARHDPGRAPPPDRSHGGGQQGRRHQSDRGSGRRDDRDDPDYDRGSMGGGARVPRPAPAPRSRSPSDKGTRDGFEFGVVKTVRDSFGFVRLLSRNGPDLFFHASEVMERNGIDDLRVNDEVKFVVREAVPGAAPRDKDGKANALNVQRLSEEDRRPVVVDASLVGTVRRGLRGRTKMDSYGGRISFMYPQSPGDAPGGTKVVNDDEFPALGGAPATPVADTKDGNSKSGETPREKSIEFEGADLDDSCPKLKPGDTVVFDVIENRFDGRRRPDRIKLSQRQEQKDADKNDKKGDAASFAVTDSEGRELGRVEKLTQSYGFIRKIGARLEAIKSGDESGGRRTPSLFFHYTNLDRATREDDLRVGDAVWFRDGNDGRSGKPTATDVGATREAEDRARAVEREEREAIAAVNAKTNPSDGDGRWGKKGGVQGDAGADDGFEYGVVVIMKASFGFIKCCDRTQDLFFHFTEVKGGEDAVSVGQEVRFMVKEGESGGGGRGGRGGGRNERQTFAVKVSPAPKGSAVFEIVSEVERKGWCRDKLMFGHRSGSYEKSGSAQPTGTLEFEVGDDDTDFPPHQAKAADKKDGKDGKDETAEEVVTEEKEGEEKDGDAVKPAAKRKVALRYDRRGLKDAKSNPRPGDMITFKIRTDKRSNVRSATEVTVVRFKGVVAAVKSQGSYGFLEHDDPDAVNRVDQGDDSESDEEPEERPEEYIEVTGVHSTLSDVGTGGDGRIKLVQLRGPSEGTEKRSRKDAAKRGVMRVFFHGSEVEGNVTLAEGDEVTYSVSLPAPGASSKEPAARKVIRTKEAPKPERPKFINTNLTPGGSSTNLHNSGNTDSDGERPAGTKFAAPARFVDAKGPDGTKGFAMGRGKGLAEAAAAAVSKLKLTAQAFVPPGGASGDDVELAPGQTEDAQR